MQSAQEEDPLLTSAEVALRVRVHVVTFQRWCRAGHGPTATLIGGQPRYLKSDVDAWIDSRKVRVA